MPPDAATIQRVLGQAPWLKPLAEYLLAGGRRCIILPGDNSGVRDLKTVTSSVVMYVPADFTEDQGGGLSPSDFHAETLKHALKAASSIMVLSGTPSALQYATVCAAAAMGLVPLLIEISQYKEADWYNFIEAHRPKDCPVTYYFVKAEGCA